MRYRGFAALLIPALLSACGTCGSNEKARALVQSLSQERFAQLHRDMEDLGLGGLEMKFLDAAEIPSAFDDLHPKGIILDGSVGRIHLSGCGDDKVTLVVSPQSGGRLKKVTLLPGETKDSVVLWQSP